MNKLDIVIPVYNEGENIAEVLKYLEMNVTTPFRVLICYDFDGDNTLPVVKRMKEQLSFTVILVKNQGSGPHKAVITGFDASDAEAVLVFVADDTKNTKIIDSMYEKFKEGNDIVVASRFMKGGCMKNCLWTKSFLVRLASFTLYWMGGIPVKDATNGFRLFSRKVLGKILIESCSGFTYSIELLVKSHRMRWNVAEVPASWYERKNGESRFHTFKWLPAYLRWYFYGFSTTYLKKSPETVKMRRDLP